MGVVELKANQVFIHVAGVMAIFVVPGFAADELGVGMEGVEGVFAFDGSVQDGDVALESHVGVEGHDGGQCTRLVDFCLRSALRFPEGEGFFEVEFPVALVGSKERGGGG